MKHSVRKRILGVVGALACLGGCAPGGAPGSEGEVGSSCLVTKLEDGRSVIECPDGTSVTLIDEENGQNGALGEDGEAGEPGQDGDVGSEGEPGQDGDPGHDGDPGEPGDPGVLGPDGAPGAPGDAGELCSVACDDERTVRISCEDGTEVTYAVSLCGDPSPAWLSVGSEHACQVRPSDRLLVCWGSDAAQKLGNGAFTVDQVSASVVDTRTLPDETETAWRFVSSARNHTCGVTAAGDAYCWGSIALGGQEGITWLPVPIDMSGVEEEAAWSSFTSGQNGTATCGLTTDGTGYCWGSDSSGERGDGAISGTTPGPSPIDTSALPGETSWSMLSAGRFHACGIATDGVAYCWGSDVHEQLGNGRLVSGNQPSPSAVEITYLPEGTTWSTISAGDSHTCAVTAAGDAYCWGDDSFGQLGRNGIVGPSDYPRPVDTSGLSPGTRWARISAGSQHTCGITTAGAAYCWGNAASGRLGNGSTVGIQRGPVAVDLGAVPSRTTWVEIAPGGAFTCGLTAHAAVYCWGSDAEGQLGNGTVSGEQTRPEHAVGVTFGILPDPVVHPSLVASGVRNVAEVAAAVGDPTNPSLVMTLLPLETPLEELKLTVASSNEAVLPATAITLTGTGAERTVSLAPLARGVSTVTFTLSSSSGEKISFPVDYAASAQPPDASGRYHTHISDASAAVDVGDGYMLLANDENNRLFLHQQGTSGPPVKVWDFVDDGTQLRPTEADIEGAARLGDQVLWITSHGNGRDGDAKEYRRVLFATTITGGGADTELAFSGRYGGGPGPKEDVASRGLWVDLIDWDQSDGHGLGADHLGFFAATRDGVVPNAPLGFNIEALEFAPNAPHGYLGFRAPTVEVDGIQHALIVPVTNILELVDGVGEQVGQAEFGAPIFLDLSGRSIRSMCRNDSADYLISAGPPDDPTPGVNDTWALYTWDGDPGHAPVLNQRLPDPDLLTGGTWESIVAVPDSMLPGAGFRLVADSGDADFYGLGQTKDLIFGLQKSYSQLFVLQ